jgi:hypothetical protein
MPRPNLLGSYFGHIKDNVVDELDFGKKIRRRKLRRELKYVFLFVGIIVVFLLVNLLVTWSDLKQVNESALAAKNNLEQSIYAIQSKDFSKAQILSQQATDEFNISLSRLQRIKYSPIGWLPGVHGRVQDVIYLADTGRILSQTINNGSGLGEVFFSVWSGDDLSFSCLTLADKRRVLATIYENRTALDNVNTDLQQAVDNLDKIKNRQMFVDRDINLDQLKLDVQSVQKITKVAVPIFQTLPALAGYPQQADYLFVLQNKDELRPTGGFIGTYGTAQVVNGDILTLITDDVYHLDMPALKTVNITPPQPLIDYLGINRWLLRDANWSPDWPSSAKQILSFYQQESAANKTVAIDPDFIIAITPDFVVDLLGITGPIKVSGQTYNKDNFMALLQDSTGKDFTALGLSRWNRKMIIGEISKQIKLKLFDNLDQNWPKLMDVIEQNLNQKNILVYAVNTDANKVFADNNWDGHLRQTDSDYVMVVDANLAALKTDAVMSRNITYRVKPTTDNQLLAKLQINYANDGNFTWKTTRYRSYVRVYVPLGSQLIRVAGFSEGEVSVGEENGKTYFGAFISVEPKSIASLSFEYELPAVVKKNEYSLIFQKQPGNMADLDIDLSFAGAIKSYQPTNFDAQLVNPQRIKFTSNLEHDNEYHLTF